MPTDTVSATPVKSFFVDMLTRDISLADAVLDLLDNSVDGILRSVGSANGDDPYDGYFAEIDFNKDEFCIWDNCGGIPWKLKDYAFRMGNPKPDRDNTIPTVGTYGIGMKRAIFKIGRDALVTSQTARKEFSVRISPAWLKHEDDWSLPVVEPRVVLPESGTEVKVGKLRPEVQEQFQSASFRADLRRKIETHYAMIIHKGFQVSINGDLVSPRPIELKFERSSGIGIKPYVYHQKAGGVEVYLVVGLTAPIPAADSIDTEMEKPRYSALNAGWTVVCNDRVVIYCDKTELTGWGEATVPKYHNQFIAISGLVEFRSKNASLLPMTTTKRGIDASSSLYLQVKNKMRRGTKLFTDFTNKWKANDLATLVQTRILGADSLSLDDIKDSGVRLRKLPDGGHQFHPNLPYPSRARRNQSTIKFSKPNKQIDLVADYFDDANLRPSEVGELCFNEIYQEARR